MVLEEVCGDKKCFFQGSSVCVSKECLTTVIVDAIISVMNIQDVTKEYLHAATPEEGAIVYDAGYTAKNHQAEIEMAGWIYRTFGGDIRLLKEINQDKVYTPDYLWHGKLWDLKKVTTEKAADSAIRHGLKQIFDNPGGIILDYRWHKIELQKLLSVIHSRMRHSGVAVVDILVILSDKNVKVFRYRK